MKTKLQSPSQMSSTATKAKKLFTFEEVVSAATDYFNGDELAANVWANKYALKNSAGEIFERTPDDMHQRMAKEIARMESKYPNAYSEQAIYEVIKDFKYIVPQGGSMTGIGNSHQVASLSNCFVIGNSNGDSYGGIMKMDQEQVQLMKRRGGVGHDLSNIRPAGTPVKNSALTATGVVPFMERYSNSTREVAQDGRRGALMLSISVAHPDAEAFIDAKLDGTKVTGANVSVKINDAFMQAVAHNEMYTQQFPIDSKNPLVTKEINARDLWNKIIHNAWKSAEPGVLFWDTVIKESIPDRYANWGFTTVSTNPCGEIPLCPYDSCRLLAINLYAYVDEPFTKAASFNFALFKKHVRMAQRIMDDIVDLELEQIDKILAKIAQDPEDESIKRVEKELWLNIKEKAIQGRRTGVGITAEGDMLAAMGITYGSDESIFFSEKIHRNLATEAYRSSVQMAEERGAFPLYDSILEEGNPFIERLRKHDPQLVKEMEKWGRRNMALLTIAPTGTTSMMTQTTSGIEPAFMVAYKRRKKVNPNDQNVRVDFVDEVGDSWEEYQVFHHKFIDWLKVQGYNASEVASYSDEQLAPLIEKSPYHQATANNVDWVQKVKLQGTIQKWVDHSISVTVNVPEHVSEELVSEIYTTGWESGCKGITVYRDGSRSGVLVTNEEKEKEESVFVETQAPKRPEILEARIVRFLNNDEKWIAVIGLLNNRPYEVFTGRAEDAFYLPSYVDSGWVIKAKLAQQSRYDFRFEDKDGYGTTIEGLSRSFNKEFWNYAKLISGVLRHGMPLPFVVDMVNNLHLNDQSLNTWKNGVVRALKGFIKDGEAPVENQCPSCGENSLIYQEGCLTCKSCGHSKCG